ncbi:MAG: hypothetical protein LUO79_00575 [Methanomassiliicoccales archaeon]|nr:hypothetical protein [Methanomassiliicoccales archaeon]
MARSGIVTMVSEKEVLDLVSGIKGVRHAFALDNGTRGRLIEIETKVRGTLDISCRNEGVKQCLLRRHVVVIIKDKRFRPPPEPTVMLVGDDGLVMGEEIFAHQREEYKTKDNVMFLSEDFVVYLDRKPKAKECFLMPPVSFPEVEALEGTKNVVSCSPSAPADMFLRKAHGLKDDPKFASVMVGWDDC